MCIYCGTKNYHKIYINHYGSIPKDSTGRAHEIHHIDGNHSNNSPTNLKLVTIQEHYDIHYSQGDWGACHAMSIRMNMSPEITAENARKHANNRVSNGTHNFLGPNNNKNRLNNGTHPFLDGSISKKVQAERIKNKTHHLLGSQHAYDRLAKGTHPSQCKITCLTCKKMTDLSHYNKFHRDNCNQSPQSNT